MIGEALQIIIGCLEEMKGLGYLEKYTFNYNVMDSIDQCEKMHEKIEIVSQLIKRLTELESKYSKENERDNSIKEEFTGILPKYDSSLVQIKADKSELNKRIEAFMKRKRKEVDEWNVQEFCSHPVIDENESDWADFDSCARIDAVFIPRSGSKSHVRVSRVINQWGPQTYFSSCKNSLPEIKTEQKTETLPQGIEERLKNMESHLKLKSGNSVPQDIYTRLKVLEDRILYLEGISPGYLHDMISDLNQTMKNRPEQLKYANWGISDIDARIQTLQDLLSQKSINQFEPKNEI
ncbi:MAP3K12-binding inhibitory protein 1-like isoform X1 [Centruroides sculpturatus]|uniref:MAP3K12-binding inhibitory protein 1-like isoform X1 n=1 Tax=Centruroides sculpturatus TaxID=218467 RepID=UPI000C6F016B|nr:MAP3K12-binding inhibitory protein 1-like isoform X1 [Centruroides sculpturatus]XP_023232725.1 MAP3K12-binding inhibitory protein 1-like isoform X1 [Centruroides sculpturatus]